MIFQNQPLYAMKIYFSDVQYRHYKKKIKFYYTVERKSELLKIYLSYCIEITFR